MVNSPLMRSTALLGVLLAAPSTFGEVYRVKMVKRSDEEFVGTKILTAQR